MFDIQTFLAGMNQAPMEEVIDEFMRALLVKDADAAFALMSPRAQRLSKIASVEQLLQGNNFILIRGYTNLEIVGRTVSSQVTTNPDAPQGRIAQVVGVIHYEDEIDSQFNAILEQAQGLWRIYSINITAPPDKFINPPVEEK